MAWLQWRYQQKDAHPDISARIQKNWPFLPPQTDIQPSPHSIGQVCSSISMELYLGDFMSDVRLALQCDVPDLVHSTDNSQDNISQCQQRSGLKVAHTTTTSQPKGNSHTIYHHTSSWQVDMTFFNSSAQAYDMPSWFHGSRSDCVNPSALSLPRGQFKLFHRKYSLGVSWFIYIMSKSGWPTESILSTAPIPAQTPDKAVSSANPPNSRTFEDETAETISIEHTDLIPKQFSHVEIPLKLLIQNVEDDAIALYFLHVHPTFPVVNEDHFIQIYLKYKRENKAIEPIELLLIYAMTLVGIAVGGCLRYFQGKLTSLAYYRGSSAQNQFFIDIPGSDRLNWSDQGTIWAFKMMVFYSWSNVEAILGPDHGQFICTCSNNTSAESLESLCIWTPEQ